LSRVGPGVALLAGALWSFAPAPPGRPSAPFPSRLGGAAATRNAVLVGFAGGAGSSLGAFPLRAGELERSRAFWTRTLAGPSLSAPIVVDRPNAIAFARTNPYEYGAFLRSEEGRRAVAVTLGADGTAHGLDAATGEEVFATNAGGTATAGALGFDDVYGDVAGTSGEPCPVTFGPGRSCRWRTVVAGATGSAVFALDVTRPDPSGFAGHGRGACATAHPPAGCAGVYGALLWKAPIEARAAPTFLRTRVSAEGVACDRFLVAVGSGDARGGRLALLEAGSGRVLFEIGEGLAFGAEGARPRPLGPLRGRISAIDTDGDGYADTLYFGDALGQLWKMWMPSAAELLPVERSGPAGPRIVSNAPRTWTPLLLFDGARERDGSVACTVARADSCAPERGIAFPPAVVSEGVDPESGRSRYGVAWVTGDPRRESSGRGRAFFLFDTAPESSPGAFVTRSLADGPGQAPEEIADPRAPQLGSCSASESARRNGWSLPLGPSEAASSAVVAIHNYLYFTTKVNRSGGPSAARFYRLFALNGDACHGLDCCPGAHSWGTGDATRDRGAGFGMDQPETTAGPFVFADPRGALHVGVVADGGASPRIRLVETAVGGVAFLRNWAEP
jgi:hypothetical protein